MKIPNIFRKKNHAPSDSNPIIVGGFYRSGTSLLRRILDSHSNIHCPPEIKFFKDFYGDYLKDDLKHVRFFSTARTFGLTEDELLDIYGNAFIASHERAARKANKKRWADKNPENLLYLNDWHRLLDGKMRFVFISRNPLDALASLLEAGFPKTVPERFDEKVDMCLKFMKKGIDFAERRPEITFLLKYEDLVERPMEELARLFDFIGERFEERILTEFVKRKKGLEDRKVMLEKNIHTKSIGRWKKDLKKEEAELVLSKCGNIMKRLVYDEPGASV